MSAVDDVDDFDDVDDVDDCDFADQLDFADPGGRSALRAGVRDLPCPTCQTPNRLSATDWQLGYQCDACADSQEGFDWPVNN